MSASHGPHHENVEIEAGSKINDGSPSRNLRLLRLSCMAQQGDIVKEARQFDDGFGPQTNRLEGHLKY